MLLLVAVATISAFYAGTLIESRRTFVLPPCTRDTDVVDNSTWQEGEASMQLFPPKIHCHFVATERSDGSRLPAVDQDRESWLGPVLAALVMMFAAAIAFGIRFWRKLQPVIPPNHGADQATE